jgi:hypothetical protein
VLHEFRIDFRDRARLARRRLGVLGCGSLGAGLAAALLAGALGSAPSASAAWTAPADLSAAGQDAYDPEVAVDDDGDFLFGWKWYDGADYRVQGRTLSAAGALGSVQTISPAGWDAFYPHVNADSDGDALFVWQRSDGVGDRARVRPLSAAGTIGVGQTMSTGATDSYGPRAAVDEDGDAVLLWYASDGADVRLYGRTRSAAGALGPVLPISGAGEPAFAGQVAVDPAGNAVFTWYRFDGTNFRVEARTLPAGGALGGVQSISDAGQHAYDPQVALDVNGNAVITWQRNDGVNNRVQTRTLSAAGVLGNVRTLSDAGEPAWGSRVALDSAGNAVIVWHRSDGNHDRVQARTMSSVGTLGLVLTLSAGGEDAWMADVAANDAGDAVFVWQRFDSIDWRIEARTLSASGNLGQTWTVSDAGGSAYGPRIAAHDGDAVVTWYRGDGANSRIQYAAGP